MLKNENRLSLVIAFKFINKIIYNEIGGTYE